MMYMEDRDDPVGATLRGCPLLISQADWQAMQEAVTSKAPEEACGLLAGGWIGDACQVQAVIPVTNALHSPTRYRMEPLEELAALERIDAQGWAMVGVYHSHPNGPDVPSPTDIAEAYYPELVHLIWSGRSGEWQCRGFRIQDGQFYPVTMRII
jgi:proteasome lid subunit RPN8/RPN11